MTPRFVAAILRSSWLWLLTRLLVTFMYWYAAIGFIIDFSGAQAAMGMSGMQPAWLIAGLTIAVQLIGSALIILDRATWLGAGMLGVFTLLTIPLVHHFWNMTGLEAMQAMLESEEHVTVVGGLIAVSILSTVRNETLLEGSRRAP
ncbi:MAG: DoxX family protein [Hyphomicrobiales bacterium]|nr:DoxX family protein [Hyphomicrobiales bacterium]